MQATTTTDEFGRDTSFRLSKSSFIFEYTKKYKGMSWAEITYAIEEEEEQEKQAKNKKQQEERTNLLKKGEYELEDGEILE